MSKTSNTAGNGATKPSIWSRLENILGRDETHERAGVPANGVYDPTTAGLVAQLIEHCSRLEADNAQLRATMQPDPTHHAQSPSGAASPPTNTGDIDWQEAYHALLWDMESLRRDNDALISEVQGRKRAQHGSRSERITPEEILVSLRALRETEPHLVPDDMLEEQERACREREEARQRRQKKREEKRQAAAEAAVRRAVRKPETNDDDDDSGGDDSGGGGGAKITPKGTTGSDVAIAQVIPFQRKPRRNSCLAGMPPQDVILPVPEELCSCPICQCKLVLIDYQDSHGLDLQLPLVRHLRYRQEKRVCPKHPESGVVMGPTVERPIAQALPTAMLLAFLVVAKVQDHLPLERLSGMFKQWGTRISPSTLGGWYQAAGDLVLPLAEHLGAAILANDACLHTDGTNIRVVDPTAPRGSTNGSLWGYTVADVGAYFEYTPDGSYDDTRAKLSARAGPTMTDGHKGYVSQRVAGKKQTIPVVNGTHLNCFDHVRRPFEAAYRLDGDPRAGTVLSRFQSLYRIEAEVKRDGLSVVQIKALRDRKSRPIFDLLFSELESLQFSVTPKSRLGGAIATMLRRKPQLEAYLANGSWPISNVLQETQFRSKAIGQHNWLFLGSHATAPHYAALLTLVRSCALLDIDPVAYLADIFMRLQQRGSAKNLDSLLPGAWKQSNAATQRQAPAAA